MMMEGQGKVYVAILGAYSLHGLFWDLFIVLVSVVVLPGLVLWFGV